MDGVEQEASSIQSIVDNGIYGTLANFKIEKKVGKGQFSEVYKARCVVNNVAVALKKVQVSPSMIIMVTDSHDFACVYPLVSFLHMFVFCHQRSMVYVSKLYWYIYIEK